MSEHANEALLRRAVDLFSQWKPAPMDEVDAPEAVVHAPPEETRDIEGASAAGGELAGPISGAQWFAIGSATFLVLSFVGTSVVYALLVSLT